MGRSLVYCHWIIILLAVLGGCNSPTQTTSIPDQIALGQEQSPYVQKAYELGQQGVDWRQNWYRGIRTADFTYVVSKLQTAKFTQRFLYDNLKDPFQLNPRVLSKDKAEEFEKELQVWLDKTNDSFSLA